MIFCNVLNIHIAKLKRGRLDNGLLIYMLESLRRKNPFHNTKPDTSLSYASYIDDDWLLYTRVIVTCWEFLYISVARCASIIPTKRYPYLWWRCINIHIQHICFNRSKTAFSKISKTSGSSIERPSAQDFDPNVLKRSALVWVILLSVNCLYLVYSIHSVYAVCEVVYQSRHRDIELISVL